MFRRGVTFTLDDDDLYRRTWKNLSEEGLLDQDAIIDMWLKVISRITNEWLFFIFYLEL